MLGGDGFTTQGEFRLHGARISGDVDISQAALSDRDGTVLDGEHMAIAGTMLCHQIRTTGQIKLFAAKIDGLFSFNHGHLENPGGLVICAEDGLTVGGSAVLTTSSP